MKIVFAFLLLAATVTAQPIHKFGAISKGLVGTVWAGPLGGGTVAIQGNGVMAGVNLTGRGPAPFFGGQFLRGNTVNASFYGGVGDDFRPWAGLIMDSPRIVVKQIPIQPRIGAMYKKLPLDQDAAFGIAGLNWVSPHKLWGISGETGISRRAGASYLSIGVWCNLSRAWSAAMGW